MQNLPLSNCDDLISFIKSISDYNKFTIYNIDMLNSNLYIFPMLKPFYSSNGDSSCFFDSLCGNNYESILRLEFQNPKILIMSKNCLTYKKTNAIFFDETNFGIVFPYIHNTPEFNSKNNDYIINNKITNLRNYFANKDLFIKGNLTHQVLCNKSIQNVHTFSINLDDFRICEYSSRLRVTETPHNLELCFFYDGSNFSLNLFYNLELIKKHSIDIDTYNAISEVQLFDTIYEFLFPFSVNTSFFNNLLIEKPDSLKEYMEVMEPYRDTYKMYKI